jgi:hypothetical protein
MTAYGNVLATIEDSHEAMGLSQKEKEQLANDIVVNLGISGDDYPDWSEQ